MKIRFLLSRYILGSIVVSLAFGLGSCGSSKKATANPTPIAGGNSSHETKPAIGPMHDHKGEKPTEKYQKDLVSTARKWIGTPYQWGGQTKDGADCSGFVLEVYRDAVGIKLPRTSYDMQEYCKKLKPDNLMIGDLVFFSSTKSRGKVAHVGIYVGNNQMIHSSSSCGVIESSLDENYWVKHYHSVGRVPAIDRMLPDSNKPQDSPKNQGQKQLAQTTSAEPTVSKARTTKHSSKKQHQTIRTTPISSPDQVPATKTEISIKSNEVTIIPKQAEPNTSTQPATKAAQPNEPPMVVITNTPETSTQNITSASQIQDTPDESPETMVANAFAGFKAP